MTKEEKKNDLNACAIGEVIALISGISVAGFYGPFWGICVAYMLKPWSKKIEYIWPKTIFFTVLIILSAWVYVETF